jgi:hypothetical protein
MAVVGPDPFDGFFPGQSVFDHGRHDQVRDALGRGAESTVTLPVM